MIVGLAGSVAMYCWAPENSETHGVAILSGQGDMSLTPVELVLGANHDASVVGTGLYSRIGALDAAASLGDVTTLLRDGEIATATEIIAQARAQSSKIPSSNSLTLGGEVIEGTGAISRRIGIPGIN